MSLVDALQLIGVIAGAITGTVAVIALGWSLYRRTVGRRRALSERLGRLAPTMQLAYFIEVLGEPQQRHRRNDSQTAVWTFADAYCQAMTRSDDTVVWWTVTTRSKRFRPTFFRDHMISDRGDSIEVTLGSTSFADLPGTPSAVSGGLGARRFSYREAFYFGNPGRYQTLVVGMNDAGWVEDHSLVSLSNEFQLDRDAPYDRVADWLAHPGVGPARQAAVINTISVSVPFAAVPHDSVPDIGPDLDQVRVLPNPGPRAGWRSWLRSMRS